MLDFLESIWDKINSGLLGIILDAILYAVAVVLYYIEAALGEVLDMVYAMFNVFAGASPVKYNGSKTYLLNVFFDDSTISVIYRGMALIGFVMLMIFALIAVGKKLFDSTGEHVKASYGMILTNTFKGGFFILAMTLFMNIMVTATGALMDSISYLFDNTEELKNPSSITFDSEDYANMFRVLDKISNRAMDPGYNNRYNLNTCFNEICNDMNTLEASGVFRFDYTKAPDSWQYDLYQIYMAADIDSGISVDVYNENLTEALLDCIDDLKYNTSFRPVSYYSKEYTKYENVNASIGTILMLSSSMNAANNSYYNGVNADITDAVRGPFYSGARDIYNLDTVESSFTIELGRWDHVTALFSLVICLVEFVKLIFHCISRIFNMIILYLVSPGFIAVLPLDDGGKLKQWTTSFIIQSFALFGNYIAVRLLTVMIPIIEKNTLVLFDNSIYNFAAKDIFIVGLCVTAQKAGAMISGILSDNAAYQSLAALESGSGIVSRGQALVGRAAMGLTKGAAGLGFGVAKKVAGAGLGALGAVTGASYLKDKIGKSFKNMGQAMRDNFGLAGAIKNDFMTDEDRKKAADEAKENARDKRQEKMVGLLEKNLGASRNLSGEKGGPLGGGDNKGNKENKGGILNPGNKDGVLNPGNKGGVLNPGNKGGVLDSENISNPLKQGVDNSLDNLGPKVKSIPTEGENDNSMNDINNFGFGGMSETDPFSTEGSINNPFDEDEGLDDNLQGDEDYDTKVYD